MLRPNVLILFTDQQRWDTIAAAGFSWMQTPNLDRLARQGVLFQNAFCNSPVCMPSRQSFFSGQYPGALGSTCNGIEMPEDVQCFQHFLKPYGYVTGNIGKLHFRNHTTRDHRDPHPLYGFDELILSDEPGCYEDAYLAWVRAQDPSAVEACRCSTPPAWPGTPVHAEPRDTHEPYAFRGPDHLTHSAFVANETIRFIESHQSRPFFAVSGFYAPHAPVNPPQRWLDAYRDVEIPLPWMTDSDRSKLGLSDEQWLEVRRAYAALVSHVDEEIGRILDCLDRLNLTEKTLIIFTSDHGEHLGDHGMVQKGPPGLESCSHVPLIASWPGRVDQGRQVDSLVELVDILPSVLDACGVQIPTGVQGRSFWPMMIGREYSERTSAWCEHRFPHGASTKMIRTPTHRYGVANDGREWLFDLEKDPGELKNLAEDPAATELRHHLQSEWIRRAFEVERQSLKRTGQY